MSEQRARFRPVDIWSPDDPAVVRLREALVLTPPPEPSQPPTPAEPEPAPTLDELRWLRSRAAAGDRSAIDRLRAVLRRFHRG